MGLGATDGEATINISSNSQSSSFRDILPRHTDAAPHSSYVGTETVRVAKLDSLIDQFCRPSDRVFLKLDVQGFEKDVLQGATQSLDRVVGLQAEMALKPLYDGETLFHEMVEHLEQLGYTTMTIAPVFADPRTGQVLQLEGIFYRQSEVNELRRLHNRLPKSWRLVLDSEFGGEKGSGLFAVSFEHGNLSPCQDHHELTRQAGFTMP